MTKTGREGANSHHTEIPMHGFSGTPPSPSPSPFRDRIRELRRVPASQLRPNPKNWRKHPQAQQEALRAMLGRVGIADAVLARELPGGALELVDGHLRSDLLGDGLVPVLVLDVDEAEADQILATLDPLAGMAEADGAKLADLLAGFERGKGDGLDGLLKDLDRTAGVVEIAPAPALPDGEREDARQMTFVLTAEQAGHVSAALASARDISAAADGNANGAALSLISRRFLGWE